MLGMRCGYVCNTLQKLGAGSWGTQGQCLPQIIGVGGRLPWWCFYKDVIVLEEYGKCLRYSDGLANVDYY